MSKPDSIKTYRRLLQFAKEFWFYLFLGFIGSICLSLIDARLTMLIKPVVNHGLNSKNMDILKWLPLQVLIFIIIRIFSSFLSSYFIGKMSRSVVIKFRQSIFSKFLSLPMSYCNHHSSGSMLSKIIYNVDQVSDASSTILLTFLREGILLLALIGLMIYENWRITLLFFLMTPLVSLVLRIFNRRIRALSSSIQDNMGTITSTAEEGIKGNAVIRLFQGQQFEQKKMDHALRLNLALELKVIVQNCISSGSMQLILAIPLLLVISPNILPYFNLSIGGLALMLAAMLQLPRPARRLSSVNAQLQKGVTAAYSIFEVLDTPDEEQGIDRLEQGLSGNIQFQNVNFSYKNTSSVTLSDINLNINSGETIGIVGFSGAGKTTLISLLPRFYSIESGDILFDGQSIKTLYLPDLRNNISLVSQQTTLFNATIRENIAYAKENVDEKLLFHVAKMAHALEFIEKLPQGFDTLIGDNGVLLSGGQRQRIAIARAFLKDTPIVIFDEATASLDLHAENKIQAAFDSLRKNRTTIVIAHRLSTIKKADRLIVMDQGKIIETGSHDELLAYDGHYAALYRIQLSQPQSKDDETLVK